MFQFRTYTLSTNEAASDYFMNHWSKHLISLPKYGFEVHGVWIGATDENKNQVFAVVSFPDSEDVDDLTKAYMSSTEFIEDMAGFDKSTIVKVDSVLMCSAIRIGR